MVKARMITKINNYNPPDDYINYADLTSAKRYLGDWDGDDYIECKHSIDNNIGRVVIPLTANEYTVISIVDDGTHYIGIIDTVRKLSANTIEVTYTVDWYTSQMLTLLEQNVGSIIAKRLMYRRVYNGEFDYLDDGITPTGVKATKIPIRAIRSSLTYSFFVEDDRYRLMVYRESETNTTHWLIARQSNVSSRNTIEAKELWDAYVATHNLVTAYNPLGTPATPKFNPKGVLFWGYIPVNVGLLPTTGQFSYDTYIIDMLTDLKTQTFVISDTRTDELILASSPRGNTVDLTLQVPGVEVKSKDWDFFRLIDYDGNIIYEFPRGVSFYDGTNSNIPLTCAVNYIETAPYVTFYFNVNEYTDGQFSFSIPFRQLSFFVDSEQVYRAEERTYQKSMRNLQSVNELFSGIVGGVNQGAMISAFSRTQTKVNDGAISKGIIGGGIGIAGAGLNFAYQSLYANKKAQEIEDKRARVQADTLLMSGSSSYYGMSYVGLYEYKYDATTIANINAYHSAFGYQTNKIELNRDITELVGYNQADIIFAPGLRTEVERYIKEMLNYGCHFTMVASASASA